MGPFDEKHASVTSTNGLALDHGLAEDEIQEKARILGCSLEEFLEVRESSKTISLEDAASVSSYAMRPVHQISQVHIASQAHSRFP